MRTTLDIPEELMDEAMSLTRLETKTELIKTALRNLIRHEKLKVLKSYHGRVDLDLDLDAMRAR